MDKLDKFKMFQPCLAIKCFAALATVFPKVVTETPVENGLLK